MNTRNEADPALAFYLDCLTIQLRLLDMPGDRIGQILAEVETHVGDTGQGPVEAFGEPGEYAATYDAAGAASDRLASRGRASVPIFRLVVPATLAVGALFVGLMQLTTTKQLAVTVDVTVRVLVVWLATGVLGMAVYRVSETQMARTTARGSRPRKLVFRQVGFVSLAYLGAIAVVVLVQELLPSGPTLVSVPGAVLFLGGLLATLVLWRCSRASKVVDPRGHLTKMGEDQ